MFCPKCGAEAVEGQRFCKSCGTNLQLIYNAIKSGDTPQGPFGLDLDALKQSAMDFANSWKTSWAGMTQEHEKHWGGATKEQQKPLTEREIRRRTREELQRRNLPRPKEWMAYSWQHNLKVGLGSLLSGTLMPTYGACFTNNSGSPLLSITINYLGRQFRLGHVPRCPRHE